MLNADQIRKGIEALGGPSGVAERIHVNGKKPTAAAVAMWKSRGWVPYRWQAAFIAALKPKKARAA